MYILNIKNIKKWRWKILENYKGIGFIRGDYLLLFIANSLLLFVEKCEKKYFVLLATNLTKKYLTLVKLKNTMN